MALCLFLSWYLYATAEAALRRGLEELVWCSDGIDPYIKETLELVKELDGILTTIKDNVANTLELLKAFERNLMFDRRVCGYSIPRQLPLVWCSSLKTGAVRQYLLGLQQVPVQ